MAAEMYQQNLNRMNDATFYNRHEDSRNKGLKNVVSH